MVSLIVESMNLILAASCGKVTLAADDRLDTPRLCLFVKIHSAVHNAVVGNCNGIHAQLNRTVQQVIKAACSVKQAVFRM